MKTPRFEEMAVRWRDNADFYIVFTREAHARAEGAEPLAQVADRLMAQDGHGDNAVTLAEYRGPIEMFEPFDLDKDGVVRAPELLAARKIVLPYPPLEHGPPRTNSTWTLHRNRIGASRGPA
jgi:hypothetical protein